MTGAMKSSLDRLARAAGDLVVEIRGDAATEIFGLTHDSRQVRPGDLFCCIPGALTDGHLYAADAVNAGAVGLLVERVLEMGVPELVVSDARRAAGRCAAHLFGDPADSLLLLGVTGTNGKTTSTFLLESIIRAEGRVAGLIGTIETHVADRVLPGIRTTPDSIDLQRVLGEMVGADVDTVAMEVTSHALVLHRIEGIRFAVAGFTNLSQDHLDFHDGMEDYFGAKRSLFTPERADKGAVNVDDLYGRRLLAESTIPTLAYGMDRTADVRAEDVELTPTGSSFRIVTPKGDVTIESPLVGSFNVYNCLGAAAIALQAGLSLEAIEGGLGGTVGVPGRFESIDAGQPFAVIVDYAHTPDSLDNVLRAAREVAARGGGRVICAFGAGGDRDRAKRPLMGSVAARLADFVIVTSDNPRSEDPAAIIDQIIEGVIAEKAGGPDAAFVDRAEAIGAAVAEARPGDVVVIAGKGHETGQEFADRKIPFDDRNVARAALSRVGWKVGK
ncbi:MAG: UDP-N-acetylmuramoyl-L-alanyl-D-glutamate--2,6-diaminopimelate ligase [Actinomycetota bacterium]